MHSILVKDYMDHNPHTLSDRCTVHDAVESLLKQGFIGCPVIDDNKKLVGFISEQDCLKEVLNEVFFCENSPPVTSLMSREVLTLSVDDSIVEVAQTMAAGKPKNYPVVTDGELVGLINRSHILKALVESRSDCI